jgi:hypothetical protein
LGSGAEVDRIVSSVSNWIQYLRRLDKRSKLDVSVGKAIKKLQEKQMGTHVLYHVGEIPHEAAKVTSNCEMCPNA